MDTVQWTAPHLPGEPSLESRESIVGGEESGSREGKLDIVTLGVVTLQSFYSCHSQVSLFDIVTHSTPETSLCPIDL